MLLCAFFACVAQVRLNPAFSQNRVIGDTLSVVFHFYQSSPELDMLFGDNMKQYDRLHEVVSRLQPKDNMLVKLSASASPEGDEQANIRLSYNRAYNTQAFLNRSIPSFFNDQTLWSVNIIGEDWAGLRREIARGTYLYKQQILDIIDSGDGSADKIARIKALDEGRTWSALYKEVFPSLRASTIEICIILPGSEGEATSSQPAGEAAPQDTVQKEEPKKVVGAPIQLCNPDSISPELLDAIVKALASQGKLPVYTAADGALMHDTPGDKKLVKTRKPKKERKPVFALKTNLLFDLATALNAEVEFPIKNKCSILLEHTFPWWLPVLNKENYALEVLRTGLEFRYWFGNRQKAPLLTGMFAGVYGNAAYFDVEWKNKGWQGETFVDCGLTWGYSFKIATNWRLETSLGVGYFDTDVTKYDHRKDLRLLMFEKEDHFRWIGPTKLKCSISWLLPQYSKKKGGKQ